MNCFPKPHFPLPRFDCTLCTRAFHLDPAGALVPVEITGTIKSPHVIHTHRDLLQSAWNLHPFLREEVVLEDLAIDIDAPNIASAGADMRQKTRNIVEHEGA